MEGWALAIAIMSFFVSLAVAWAVHFRPANLIGTISHVVSWQFSSYEGYHPTGNVCAKFLTPNIWIGNSGAATAVIEEIRLVFESEAKDFVAYPVSKVGLEIVEDPGKWSEKSGLGNNGPMTGFALKGGDEWKNEFAFTTKLVDFERLYGRGLLKVQAKIAKEKGWKTIISEPFNFGIRPYHLEPLKSFGGTAGSMTGYTYSEAWHERRKA